MCRRSHMPTQHMSRCDAERALAAYKSALCWGPLALAGIIAICVFTSAALQQQALWPFATLSRYGAQWPSIILFRVGTTSAAILMLTTSLIVLRTSSCFAAGALTVSAIGLAGVGAVSILEHWALHNMCTALFFLGFTSFQITVVSKLYCPVLTGSLWPSPDVRVPRRSMLASVLLVAVLFYLLLS